jgi:hypothetical protein
MHTHKHTRLALPAGVQRGLVGDIISRFERKGFTLRALKLFQCPRELAEEHYKDLASKPFFPKLVDYILSGPVVCMVSCPFSSLSSPALLPLPPFFPRLPAPRPSGRPATGHTA